ncbi:inorganic pyrophosphatase [Condylostylus longicornis]|uniref:inorganic pyrophosphatase n=1 Tax=Condylostylus longicornis TaxID=2530218 RepID=UPI00244E45B3|nr:inorganic pyrophosphatase [Condylostylus longicornis]
MFIRTLVPVSFVSHVFCRRATSIVNKKFFNLKTNLLHQKAFNKKYLKMQKYAVIEKGVPNSTTYSIYFRDETGNAISPLHDIPLFANDSKNVYNMVVEVPRWTNAKMEISLKTPMNPIKQDVKKGKLRFVANCFPHHGYIWNYGAFPQTWENPNFIEPTTGCKGDNDPIDVLEIGYRVAKRGEVMQVKVLGCVALIDEGETDWKIIAINVNDPLAEQLNDIEDVEKFLPGLLRATVEWFKIYKVPDGKPENQFAFNGDAKNAEFAVKQVLETHKFWKALISKELESDIIHCANITQETSPFVISQDQANNLVDSAADDGTPEEISDIVDKWHYVYLK